MGWLDAYDRHAGNAASGNQLGFELGAVGAAASAGLGVLVVGVHVSTVCYVDTMLLHPRRQCQMGWPDAYQEPRVAPTNPYKNVYSSKRGPM